MTPSNTARRQLSNEVERIIAVFCLLRIRAAQDKLREQRREAEYYVAAYAQHYSVPVEFVRAVVEQESGWQRCPVSSKGAAGLMQLMPATAARLNVRNRCDINQNVSGGVRYLAWLMNKFHGDLRLVAAAYYAGENIVQRRGLSLLQSRCSELCGKRP